MPETRVSELIPPPGLNIQAEEVEPIDLPPSKGSENETVIDPCEEVNPWVGEYPLDINQYDFTLQEDECRALLFGRDTWLVPQEQHTAHVLAETDERVDHTRIKELAAHHIKGLPWELHTPLLNWIALDDPKQNCEFEASLACGLRNVAAHGNSILRNKALETLSRMKNLDRYHAGDGGICRITWGKSAQLDDCVSQMLWIGPLHFCAIDYGDTLSLPEHMQQKVLAVDKEERNQCTLLAVAAGIIALDLKSGNIPARTRTAKLAAQLRYREWTVAHPICESQGEAKSYNARTLCSLSHDILHPNHDRDYRSLSIFLSPYLQKGG